VARNDRHLDRLIELVEAQNDLLGNVHGSHFKLLLAVLVFSMVMVALVFAR
jgi:hypothetical protein